MASQVAVLREELRGEAQQYDALQKGAFRLNSSLHREAIRCEPMNV